MSETNLDHMTNPQLFSKQHIVQIIVIVFLLGGIIGVYYLLQSLIEIFLATHGQVLPINQLPRQPAPRSNDKPLGPPSDNGPLNSIGNLDLWPLWGVFMIPTAVNLILSLCVVGIFLGQIYVINRRADFRISTSFATLAGIILIIGTNLIVGWQLGVLSSIGGTTEIFQDAVQISSTLNFIREFNSLQAILSVHAQTQPPGATLVIYWLFRLLKEPGYIALAIAIIATYGSVFFFKGILTSMLDLDPNQTNYILYLFLLLPAIQVYYLANIYAIVATLILGTTYFYFHQNQYISIIGSTICLILGTFTSFLAVYIILCLGLYELFQEHTNHGLHHIKRIYQYRYFKYFLSTYSKLIVMSSGLVVFYSVLLTLNFNYIEAFLFASSLENPNGFMLLANPIQYVVTRIQNIMDILVFFGPVLLLFSFKGLKFMSSVLNENKRTQKSFNLIIAVLMGLILLFATGAAKKGETARICLFIYPFLLIPVACFLAYKDYSKRDKIILLGVVFLQSILMQLFFNFVW